MPYNGVIIEESLEERSVLKDIHVVKTVVEPVTEEHKTPWLSQWTMHTVEIPEEQAEDIAMRLSLALEAAHAWYADFKNATHHYIIFRNKVFCVDRRRKDEYDAAKQYGMSLGIPEYQVDFHPEVIQWER